MLYDWEQLGYILPKIFKVCWLTFKLQRRQRNLYEYINWIDLCILRRATSAVLHGYGKTAIRWTNSFIPWSRFFFFLFILSSKLWAQQWAESPISVRRVRGCLANVKSEREAEGNLCFGYFLVMRRSSVKCIRNQMRYAPENLFAPKILRAAARCRWLEVAHLHLGRFILSSVCSALSLTLVLDRGIRRTRNALSLLLLLLAVVYNDNNGTKCIIVLLLTNSSTTAVAAATTTTTLLALVVVVVVVAAVAAMVEVSSLSSKWMFRSVSVTLSEGSSCKEFVNLWIIWLARDGKPFDCLQWHILCRKSQHRALCKMPNVLLMPRRAKPNCFEFRPISAFESKLVSSWYLFCACVVFLITHYSMTPQLRWGMPWTQKWTLFIPCWVQTWKVRPVQPRLAQNNKVTRPSPFISMLLFSFLVSRFFQSSLRQPPWLKQNGACGIHAENQPLTVWLSCKEFCVAVQWCVVSGAFNTSNQVSIEVAGNASTLQVAYKVEVEMSLPKLGDHFSLIFALCFMESAFLMGSRNNPVKLRSSASC